MAKTRDREELKDLCKQFNSYFAFDKGDDGRCGVSSRDTEDDIEIRLTNGLKRELTDDRIVKEFTESDEDIEVLIEFADEKGIIQSEEEDELEEDEEEDEEEDAPDAENEEEPETIPEYVHQKVVIFGAEDLNVDVARNLSIVLELLADPTVPEVRIVKGDAPPVEEVEDTDEEEEEDEPPKPKRKPKAKPKTPNKRGARDTLSLDDLSKRFLSGDLQSSKSRLNFIEENDVPTKKDPKDMTAKALAFAIKAWAKKQA